jgi:hypothetical protein
MAIDAQTLSQLLASARPTNSRCATAGQLAGQLSELHEVFSEIINLFQVEINNLTNNGGGGATTPVYIVRASVNQLGGVPASQIAFQFDGASDLLTYNDQPSGITAGVARNPGRNFQDNEVVKLISFNGTTFLADKISDDDEIIEARVNQPGDVTTDDTTFLFDNAIAIGDGFAPAGGTGIAINITRNAFADNERIVLRLVRNPALLSQYGLPADSQAWVVVQDDDDLGGGTGGGGNYTPWFGIHASDMTNSNRVGLDITALTGYDPTKVQAAGHNTQAGQNGIERQFRWLNIDVIEINLV